MTNTMITNSSFESLFKADIKMSNRFLLVQNSPPCHDNTSPVWDEVLINSYKSNFIFNIITFSSFFQGN